MSRVLPVGKTALRIGACLSVYLGALACGSADADDTSPVTSAWDPITDVPSSSAGVNLDASSSNTPTTSPPTAEPSLTSPATAPAPSSTPPMTNPAPSSTNGSSSTNGVLDPTSSSDAMDSSGSVDPHSTDEEISSASSDSETTTGNEPTAPCEYPEPPPEVAAWVEESWNAQLGDNIRNRSAWLLDNVIKGEGELNLCVRWGATTAPSAAVKAKVAASVERWFNDWFEALGDYGCFPYGDGIDVKVTGWAVRPGNEAWVADLDESVRVYTELDGEGEPKCPDACSFFNNWSHEFPQCDGGENYHTDYWIWVSDQLPHGGAAAVGGDWGLRMPVDAFVQSIDRDADLVIEHEIGHGFGFQDYYDWTGSRPTGGSLMIVGSTTMQSPTVGDAWLIRRTWREMQQLRGW